MSVADFAPLYADAAQQYGIDPNLLMAQAQVESGGDPTAIGPQTRYGKAKGIAQLVPATAASLGVTDPTDPAQAIPAQAKLMAENINRYGDVPTALLAYHGGTDQSNWGPKTKAYAAQVLKNYKAAPVNDPIEQLLSAPSTPPQADPIEQLLSAPDENTTSNAAPPSNATAPPPSTAGGNTRAVLAEIGKLTDRLGGSDIVNTVPSAIARGVGAVPQALPMGLNALVNSGGEIYGKLAGATPEQQQRLSNLNPFFTGNTLSDALVQSANAIAGAPAPANPITGQFFHDPTTAGGRAVNNLIEATVAGKASQSPGLAIKSVSLPTAIGGGAGAFAAGEAFPNSPTAQLIGGITGAAFGKLGKDAVTPTPIAADAATVIKAAKDQFGIDTPTGAMTNGGNLLEKLAGKSDTNALTGQVNRATADSIGANDNGEGHTVINQDAIRSANTNNGAAYDSLFKAIGNVPIDQHIVPILSEIEKIGSPTFKAIGDRIQELQNPDGTLPASAIKDLTNSNSVLQKLAGNKTDTPGSLAASNIIDSLNAALKDKATPEQAARLNEIDTRYKMMKAMQPVARTVGAGQQASIPAIQNMLNRSFSDINNTPLPPTDLSNYLNTISPGSKSVGGFGGLKEDSTRGADLLNHAEAFYALASHNPLMAALPIAQRGAMIGASKIASHMINTDWYKNRLLSAAQP